MAQTINIYMGESDPASTDFTAQESISQIPSPEGMGGDDVIVSNDSSAPVPEMFMAAMVDASSDESDVPSPSLMADDDAVPVPADDLAEPSAYDDVPEPEDLEEDSAPKVAGKKSAVRKTKS